MEACLIYLFIYLQTIVNMKTFKDADITFISNS
jgi:hypothetical protein